MTDNQKPMPDENAKHLEKLRGLPRILRAKAGLIDDRNPDGRLKEISHDYRMLAMDLERNILPAFEAELNTRAAQPVNQVMLEALKYASKVFREYEKLHLDKKTDDGHVKAFKNAEHARILEKAIALAEQQEQDTIPSNWRELLKLSQNNYQHNFGMKPFKLGADWVYKDLEELFSSTGRYENCVDRDTVAIPREVLERAIMLIETSFIDAEPLAGASGVSLLKPYVKGGE